MGTVLCTHKRDFATVTLIPGRCFDQGGGGGIGFYNNQGEEPNFSIFPESLGPKGSDWCSFQVDGPPQAILEPRRVRVTLIPGSTLQLCIETLCKRTISVAHLTNFSFEFFYKIFTEDTSLPLLYHGAKKSKMTKKSNQGGVLPLKLFLKPAFFRGAYPPTFEDQERNVRRWFIFAIFFLSFSILKKH